jgi:transcriptional regulator with XRE-family HTH domain
MVARSARLREQLALAESLRADGRTWSEVAAGLRTRYGLNARVAMRISHGWTQAQAAQAWNRRWPDEPKTFKNISYWENWPSPTGHMPSLHVLDRLAQIYECDVPDLLAGWGEHAGGRGSGAATDGETLAWQASADPSGHGVGPPTAQRPTPRSAAQVEHRYRIGRGRVLRPTSGRTT